jgi:hypothetical protein
MWSVEDGANSRSTVAHSSRNRGDLRDCVSVHECEVHVSGANEDVGVGVRAGQRCEWCSED